jgi:hypothetical protein
MVLYLIILLIISIAGMLFLLAAKRYELSSGNLILAGARPRLSKFSSRTMFLFGTAIPHYLRWQASRLYFMVRAWAHRAVARVVVTVEHWLEQTLHQVREKTTPVVRTPGEASPFLREVGEYKKKLTNGTDKIEE